MEQRADIRRRVLTGQMSKRAACRKYDIHWQTLEKMLAHSVPPGYRESPPRGSKLDPFLPVIEEILKSDRTVHRKQRHNGQRIFERLREYVRYYYHERRHSSLGYVSPAEFERQPAVQK